MAKRAKRRQKAARHPSIPRRSSGATRNAGAHSLKAKGKRVFIVKTFKAGIVAPNTETAQLRKSVITATGMAEVIIQSTEYYSSKTDWPVRRFVEASPEIVARASRFCWSNTRCFG